MNKKIYVSIVIRDCVADKEDSYSASITDGAKTEIKHFGLDRRKKTADRLLKEAVSIIHRKLQEEN